MELFRCLGHDKDFVVGSWAGSRIHHDDFDADFGALVELGIHIYFATKIADNVLNHAETESCTLIERVLLGKWSEQMVLQVFLRHSPTRICDGQCYTASLGTFAVPGQF